MLGEYSEKNPESLVFVEDVLCCLILAYPWLGKSSSQTCFSENARIAFINTSTSYVDRARLNYDVRDHQPHEGVLPLFLQNLEEES